MYECRDDRAIFADLAARLGINDDDDRTEEPWLRELTKDAVDDFEAFRDAGVARFAVPKDVVAFVQQIRDPDSHRFTTPSGKIEIYSLTMAAKPDRYGLGDKTSREAGVPGEALPLKPGRCEPAFAVARGV